MKLNEEMIAYFQQYILNVLTQCIDLVPYSAYAKFNPCVSNLDTLAKASEPSVELANEIIENLKSHSFNGNEELKTQVDFLITKTLSRSTNKLLNTSCKLQAIAIKNLFETAIQLIPKPPHLTTFNVYTNSPNQNPIAKIHESLDSIDELFSSSNSTKTSPSKLSKSTSTTSLLSDTLSFSSSLFETSNHTQEVAPPISKSAPTFELK